MIDVAEWIPADDLILEPNAMEAVTQSIHNLVLTAGPGAGKTEMLAQRADFLLRTGVSPFPKRILAISFKVDASTNLKFRVKKRCGRSLASRFDSYTFHAFAKGIIDRFRVALTGRDALDPDYEIGEQRVDRKQITFKDLIPLATQILRQSEVARKAIRYTYSDVFLDEFQDCTSEQYELFRTAFMGAPIRVTAVGDVKQRIMGWAGALEGIFATYAEEFNAIELVMFRNFRSQSQILRVQNSIIQYIDPHSAVREEQIKGNDGLVSIRTFDNSMEEAVFLANHINNLINVEGIAKSEIAVLVRAQADVYTYELRAAFDELMIEYRNEQDLQDISTQPLAKLIVDYLLVILGKKEPKSWVRLMDIVVPYLESEQQQVIQSNWVEKFREDRRVLREQGEGVLEVKDIWPLVIQFLSDVGPSTITSLSPEYVSKERVGQVVSQTKDHILDLFERTGGVLGATKLFFDDDAVRILTIHKSKGLEFDTVILLAIENQTYFGDQNESLSTFFVGVSRAKRELLLTSVAERTRPEFHKKYWKVNRSEYEQYLDFVRPYVNV